MATDLSSTTVPYASAEDLLLVYDYRLVGQTFTTDNTQADEAEIAASDVVANALLSASGDVEAKVMVGGMYSVDMLTTIGLPSNPADITATGKRLKRIVCGLAFWRLWLFRHPMDSPDKFPGVVEALADLDAIAEGEAIFGSPPAIDAGLPETTPWVNPVDYSRHVLEASRFFPGVR